MSRPINEQEPKYAPRYQADVDYIRWQEYLADCEENEIKPTISDYLLWLEEDGYDAIT